MTISKRALIITAISVLAVITALIVTVVAVTTSEAPQATKLVCAVYDGPRGGWLLDRPAESSVYPCGTSVGQITEGQTGPGLAGAVIRLERIPADQMRTTGPVLGG